MSSADHSLPLSRRMDDYLTSEDFANVEEYDRYNQERFERQLASSAEKVRQEDLYLRTHPAARRRRRSNMVRFSAEMEALRRKHYPENPQTIIWPARMIVFFKSKLRKNVR